MVSITDVQKQIVKDTWEIPKRNPLDSGELIFVRFLKKYPHNKEKFAAFRNIPLLSLKGNTGVRCHAARIMKVFQAAVDAFDSADPERNLKQVWTTVAVTHSYNKVQEDSFNELREVVLEVLTTICALNHEQQQAWGVLFDIAYSIVFAKLEDIYQK